MKAMLPVLSALSVLSALPTQSVLPVLPVLSAGQMPIPKKIKRPVTKKVEKTKATEATEATGVIDLTDEKTEVTEATEATEAEVIDLTDATDEEHESMLQHVINKMKENTNQDIHLLKDPTVIQWLYGDMSFLPPIQSKNKTRDTVVLKKLEDEWGQQMMRGRRPDLTLDKQWTNRFGEYLCEEILMLLGSQPYKPKNIEGYQPDVEVENAIWEAKAQTYFTSGTAGEKIMGCPVKYAAVPRLYGKPLYILCIGGAEKICREKYSILPGPNPIPEVLGMVEYYRTLKIDYIGYTDLLEKWVSL